MFTSRLHGLQGIAGGKKKERLVTTVRQQVKNRHDERAQAARHDHEADLTHRGISQDLLDIGLGQRDQAREQCGARPDDRDHRHRDGRQHEQRAQTHQQERPGIHHGRGMNQRRHGRRSLHRKGQPNMKRQLCGFPHRTRKQTQHNERDGPHLQVEAQPSQHVDGMVGQGRCLFQDLGNIERPERHKGQDHAKAEPDVGHGVNQKSLGRCGAGRGSFRPMRNQEIRTQAHDFPKYVQHEQIPAHHQHEHGKGKECNDRKEPVISGIPDHIPG